MVGWVCSLISNSPQNVCLIRQFALLVSVGREEGLRGRELAHPQAWGQVLWGSNYLFGVTLKMGLLTSRGLSYVSVTSKLRHRAC